MSVERAGASSHGAEHPSCPLDRCEVVTVRLAAAEPDGRPLAARLVRCRWHDPYWDLDVEQISHTDGAGVAILELHLGRPDRYGVLTFCLGVETGAGWLERALAWP